MPQSNLKNLEIRYENDIENWQEIEAKGILCNLPIVAGRRCKNDKIDAKIKVIAAVLNALLIHPHMGQSLVGKCGNLIQWHSESI